MTGQGLESKDFVEQAAEVIGQHGLHLPALIVLEAFRPFAFLGGQLLWVLQPSLGLVAPKTTIGELARFLEDSRAIDSLIERLDADKKLGQRGTPWI